MYVCPGISEQMRCGHSDLLWPNPEQLKHLMLRLSRNGPRDLRRDDWLQYPSSGGLDVQCNKELFHSCVIQMKLVIVSVSGYNYVSSRSLQVASSTSGDNGNSDFSSIHVPIAKKYFRPQKLEYLRIFLVNISALDWNICSWSISARERNTCCGCLEITPVGGGESTTNLILIGSDDVTAVVSLESTVVAAAIVKLLSRSDNVSLVVCSDRTVFNLKWVIFQVIHFGNSIITPGIVIHFRGI